MLISTVNTQLVIFKYFSESSSSSMPWKHGEGWRLYLGRVWQFDCWRFPVFASNSIQSSSLEIPSLLPGHSCITPINLH